jgi:hypothetical protein
MQNQSTFKIDYAKRVAAENQEMGIGKYLKLEEDLKIHNNFSVN